MLKKTTLTSFFFIFLLVSFVFFDGASAYTVNKVTNFEDGTVGYDYNSTDGFYHFKDLMPGGGFGNGGYIDTLHTYSGMKSWHMREIAVGVDYYTNISYTYSDQIFNYWSTQIYITDMTASDGDWTVMFYFNGSNHNYIQLRLFNYQDDKYSIAYYTLLTGWTTFIHNISINAWHRFGFYYLANDTVHYFNDTIMNYVLGTPNIVGFPPHIKFTTVYLSSNVPGTYHYIWLDDMESRYGTEYFSGGFPGGCVDFRSYERIDHLRTFNNVELVKVPYIELCGASPLTGKVEGFQQSFHVDQIEADGDGHLLNHYGLYINGQYAGSPGCYYKASSVSYVMQWDLRSINITLNNQIPVMEIYHDIADDYGRYFYVATEKYISLPMPIYESLFKSSDGSYLNGICDGQTLIQNSPIWSLYYTKTTFNETNPNYDNSITIKDSVGYYLPNHPVYNKPFSYVYKTIYFDVYTNLSNVYHLNVFREGVPVGFSQYYPKLIPTYHEIFGFTPLNQGNYTVSLYDDMGVFVNKSFNITNVTVPFAIFTSVNPTNQYSNIQIVVYAYNPNSYANYSIVIDKTLSDLNVYSNDRIDQKITFEHFIGNFYYVETNPGSITGELYIRLFATNGSIFFPITGVYVHNIEGVLTENYILSSLTNNIGKIGQEFRIYGKYSNILGSAEVFLNGIPIYPVSMATYSFTQTHSKPGSYLYELRENQNGTWISLSSVTVSISSETQEGTSVFNTDFGVFINTILALLLIVLITMSPLIITMWLSHGTNITVAEIPGLLYVAMFLVSMVINVIIGWLPIWSLLFVLLGLVVSFVVFWFNKNKE